MGRILSIQDIRGIFARVLWIYLQIIRCLVGGQQDFFGTVYAVAFQFLIQPVPVFSRMAQILLHNVSVENHIGIQILLFRRKVHIFRCQGLFICFGYKTDFAVALQNSRLQV